MEPELEFGDLDLREIVREALLELVKAGEVCVNPHPDGDGRRTFIAVDEASDADREFTKEWLKNPHFVLDA